MNDLFIVIILFILIGMSAFLSATETSLFSLSPFLLRSYRSSNDVHQQVIASLMAKPRDLLVLILMLNVLSNLLIQNTASSLFNAYPTWMIKVGIPLALVLVFGEIIPKSIAFPNNVAIARFAAPIMSRLIRFFGPLLKRFNMLASYISRVLFVFLKDEQEIDSDEYRHIVSTSLSNGVLTQQEADLIEGALDLKEATVKELMRPRDEVLFYDIHEPIEQLLALFVDKKRSRVPICDGPLDRLLGIISVKRFFFHRDQMQSGAQVASFAKKPFYIPESTPGWSLLASLRERGENMAIVVDEYGSISGLITQDDLIEKVVGKMADHLDEKSLYTRSGTDVVIASGKWEISEFEDLFQVKLPTKEHPVTLGGWLIEQLGDIPKAGTRYATDDFLFYVLAADPNRIRRIYVRRIRSLGKRKDR